MLTIVFYGSDGKAAKARAKQIAATKPNIARVYDAMTWGGSADACDAVEVLPCVPWWKRDVIGAAYSGKVSEGIEITVPSILNPDDWDSESVRRKLGDLPKRRGRPPKVRDDAA